MNFKTAPSFSLSKSLKKCTSSKHVAITDMSPNNPMVPGPIYNISGLGQSKPSLSIGKSQRADINYPIEQTPSPMDYQPKSTTRGVQHSIPRSSFVEPKNMNPDPACYITDQKQTAKKVISYTLPSRYPSIMENGNRNPGPADYQTIQPLPILSRSKNSKQAAFGSASRFKEVKGELPGAGQYEITNNRLSQFDQKYSIGKADREKPIQSTPGRKITHKTASDYHKLSFVEADIKNKIGKSLGGKIKTRMLNETTTINAFHKYFQNPQTQFAAAPTSPKYSLGKQKRELIKTNQNPGPAEYINNDFLVKHSSVALMPLSEHKQYDDSAFKPGPGTYRIEVEKGPQYSFPRSKSMASVSNAPGVGRYEVEISKINKGTSFGKSSRFVNEGGLGVGVGAYNLSGEMDFKGSIGKSSRFRQHIYSTPGPGDYHVHSLIGRKSQLQK